MNELISLSTLFNQAIFRIPDYQRGYAWKEPQLVDFWDDLYNLNGNRYHYTGMLSLKELSKEQTSDWTDEKWLIDKDYKTYHIVDGQQRLTTFMILLNSIINCITRNNHDFLCDDEIEDIKKKYIVVNNKRNGILKTYLFGYEKDNPSFMFLRYRIFGEDYAPTIEESFYTLNLEYAKKFFDNKIDTLYKTKGLSAIEELFLKLTNKLQFNVHYIKDDFDVYVAFETMNNRGKRLSNLEILKNRLIYLTTIYDDNILSLDEKIKLRNNINETWSEVYYQLGRNKNEPLIDDEFLKNHWTLYFKYSRTTGDDYINFLLNKQFSPKAIYGEKVKFEFEKYIDETYDVNDLIDTEDDTLYPLEIQNYVLSLKEVAPYWYYSFNPSDNNTFTKEEIELVSKLNRVGISYFRTLVVASFINKSVTVDQRIELLKVIERFIFICFRMARYQSSYLSNKSYDYARCLLKGEVSVIEIIEFFDEKTEEIKSDAVKSFANNINRYFTNYDGFYSWSELKYVLFEYEAELAKNKAVKHLDDWSYFTKSEKDKVSIEHIFPQKPTKYYWRNQFRKYSSDEERHYLTNSLGNLLALSQSINSSLQNDDFNKKKNPSNGRAGYSNGSLSEIEVANTYNDWTPQTILDRGLKILEYMEKRWDFNFSSEEEKISLLGLSFLFDDREDVPELEDVDYTMRDSYFKGVKAEIRVSEYLNKSDLYLVKYYFKLYEALKQKIPTLYETATKNYISLKCNETNNILAEIHIQNSKKKICIITREPKTIDSSVGERIPDNFLWSLNYRIYLKEDENFNNAIEVIYATYLDRLSFNSQEVDEIVKDEDIRKKRSIKTIELLKRYELENKIIILTQQNRYIRFTTPILRRAVGELGDGSWDKITDLLVYEISNKFDKANISLYVGPGKKEVRDYWLSFAKNNNFFKVLKGDKWTAIHRMMLFEDDDILYEDNLIDYLNDIVPKIDNIFKK